ncbi:MAG: ribonuclease III [Oscillospiraceae bacterium]|nr:ribonuclease III [Oscillospiraceae bacterium]
MLFSEKKIDPREYNPLALAYIGDTVFDLFVRTKLLEGGNRRVTDLHKRAVKLVNASAQAEIVHIMEGELSEDELGILKWGRNAKVNNHPNRSTIGEYHLATGLETLIGFLYLEGKEERLCELLEKAYLNFNKE